MLQFNYSGKTHVGLIRTNNEDIYRIERELGFCLVADGLGGAAAGEVASQIFSETAFEVFQDSKDRLEKEIIVRIQNTFRLANENILNHVRKNPLHGGMGCTAELLVFSDVGIVLGHMGDSRTYRCRRGCLKQITKDHSLVQNQLDKGIITPNHARTHRLRNIVLRAVGIDEQLSLDIVRGQTLPEDQFLLCSDGLTDMVDDTLIQKTLNSGIEISQKVDELVEIALASGGKDNITVVLIEAK